MLHLNETSVAQHYNQAGNRYWATPLLSLPLKIDRKILTAT